jgi:hypothetical protein
VPEVPSGDFATPGEGRRPRKRKGRRFAAVRPARPEISVRRRDLPDVPYAPRRRGRCKAGAQTVPAHRTSLHRLPQDPGHGRPHPARSEGDRGEQRMRAVPPAPRRRVPMDVGTAEGNWGTWGSILPFLPPRRGREEPGVASSPRRTSDERHGVPAASGPVPKDRSRWGNVSNGSGLLPDVPRCPRKRHHAGGAGCRKTPSVGRGGKIRKPSECGDLLGVPPWKGGKARIGGLPLLPPPPL